MGLRCLFILILIKRWTGSRIRTLFLCVSYGATKRVSRWQRVYSVGLRRPHVGISAQNATTILKPLVPDPDAYLRVTAGLQYLARGFMRDIVGQSQ